MKKIIDPENFEYDQVEENLRPIELLKETTQTAKEFSGLMHDIKDVDNDGIYIVDTGRANIINPYD